MMLCNFLIRTSILRSTPKPVSVVSDSPVSTTLRRTMQEDGVPEVQEYYVRDIFAEGAINDYTKEPFIVIRAILPEDIHGEHSQNLFLTMPQAESLLEKLQEFLPWTGEETMFFAHWPDS